MMIHDSMKTNKPQKNASSYQSSVSLKVSLLSKLFDEVHSASNSLNFTFTNGKGSFKVVT